MDDAGADSNPYLKEFYELLSLQVDQIKQLDCLDKSALAALRAILSITLFEGRRTPTIITTQKYEEWTDHYIT